MTPCAEVAGLAYVRAGSKSRVNFLELPRDGRDDCVIDAAALSAVPNGAFLQHRRA